MRFLAWAMSLFGGSVVLVVVGWLGASAVGMRIGLDRWRDPLASFIGAALDADVRMSGPIELAPGLWPRLKVRDVAVDFRGASLLQVAATLQEASIQVSIGALLGGALEMGRVTAKGVLVIVESRPAAPASPTAGEADTHRATGLKPWWAYLRGIESLAIRDVAVQYWRHPGRAARFELQRVDGASSSASGTSVEALGRYAGGQALSASLDGGPLTDLLPGRQGWPTMSVSLQSSTVRVDLTGSVAPPGGEHATSLTLTVAERAPGQSLNQAGASTDTRTAFALEAQIALKTAVWHVEGLHARFGDSEVSAQLHWPSRESRPVVHGRLQFSKLTAQDLAQALSAPAAGAGPAGRGGWPLWIALLQDLLLVIDTDLQVAIHSLQVAGAEIGRLSFAGRVRRSQLTQERFELWLGGTRYVGMLSAVLKTRNSELNAWLVAERGAAVVDPTNMNDRSALQLDVDQSAAGFAARGATREQWLNSAALMFRVHGLRAEWPTSGPDGDRRLQLDELQVRLPALGSTELTASGTFDGQPLSWALSAPPMAVMLGDMDRAAVHLDVQWGDTELNLSSQLQVPIDERSLSFFDTDVHLRDTDSRCDLGARRLRLADPWALWIDVLSIRQCVIPLRLGVNGWWQIQGMPGRALKLLDSGPALWTGLTDRLGLPATATGIEEQPEPGTRRRAGAELNGSVSRNHSYQPLAIKLDSVRVEGLSALELHDTDGHPPLHVRVILGEHGSEDSAPTAETRQLSNAGSPADPAAASSPPSPMGDEPAEPVILVRGRVQAVPVSQFSHYVEHAYGVALDGGSAEGAVFLYRSADPWHGMLDLSLTDLALSIRDQHKLNLLEAQLAFPFESLLARIEAADGHLDLNIPVQGERRDQELGLQLDLVTALRNAAVPVHPEAPQVSGEQHPTSGGKASR